MIQSSDLIDWPKILLVEFDYRYYRFNRIFGYRLRVLMVTWFFRWGEFVYPSSAVPPTGKDLVIEDEVKEAKFPHQFSPIDLKGGHLHLHPGELQQWSSCLRWSSRCSPSPQLPLTEEQKVVLSQPLTSWLFYTLIFWFHPFSGSEVDTRACNSTDNNIMCYELAIHLVHKHAILQNCWREIVLRPLSTDPRSTHPSIRY